MYRVEKILQTKKGQPNINWLLCQCDRASELFDRSQRAADNLPDKSVVRYPGGPDDGWSDVASLDEAIKLGLYGWREGEKLLEEKIARAQVIQNPLSHRSTGVDVGGAYPLVPLAVAGDPMCMVTPDADSIRTKPVVRLVVNVAVSGNVSREVIYARGGAILAWVDELEASGYRCEIVIIETGIFGRLGKDPKGVIFMATGKSPEEPLDIDRMSFLLCHPSVQRRVFFSLYEGDEIFERELGLSKPQLMTYGQPTDDIPHDFLGAHSVYFPAMKKAVGDWASPLMAVTAVERMILKNLQLENAGEDAEFDAEPKVTEEIAA